MSIVLSYLKNNPQAIQSFIKTLVSTLTFLLFGTLLISSAMVGAWGLFSFVMALLILRAYLMYGEMKDMIKFGTMLHSAASDALNKINEAVLKDNIEKGISPSVN